MAQHPKAKPKPKGRKSTVANTDKAQSARFIQAARNLGVDESGEQFKEVVSRVLLKRERPS